MKLYVLFGQRRQNYPGQYGAEALACATEYDLDENPSYLRDKRDEYKNFSSLEIVTLIVDETKLDKILRSEKPILNAVISSE